MTTAARARGRARGRRGALGCAPLTLLGEGGRRAPQPDDAVAESACGSRGPRPCSRGAQGPRVRPPHGQDHRCRTTASSSARCAGRGRGPRSARRENEARRLGRVVRGRAAGGGKGGEEEREEPASNGTAAGGRSGPARREPEGGGPTPSPRPRPRLRRRPHGAVCTRRPHRGQTADRFAYRGAPRSHREAKGPRGRSPRTSRPPRSRSTRYRPASTTWTAR